VFEYESGHKFRVISTFKVNEQKNIWGNYIFENYDRDENKENFGDGEVYKGVFFKGKIEFIDTLIDAKIEKSEAETNNLLKSNLSDRPIVKIKVFWMDDFGDGYLNMNFMPGVSFKGDWGLEKHEGTWSGLKCNPQSPLKLTPGIKFILRYPSPKSSIQKTLILTIGRSDKLLFNKLLVSASLFSIFASIKVSINSIFPLKKTPLYTSPSPKFSLFSSLS
jgi:hypothetical protein